MFKKIVISLFILFLLPIKTLATQVNIAFTIDNNYFIPTMLTINSILKNNKSKSDYTFYVIENNLTFWNKRLISKFIRKNKQELKIIHYSNSLLQSDCPNYFQSYMTMARVILPDLLPQNIDKIIYLDADTLVVTDIKELYDTDLGQHYAGLVLDSGIAIPEDACGFKYTKGYFNSGVILIDLKKWRKDKITDKMTTFVKNHKNRFIGKEDSTSCKYLYPDQDLINTVLHGKIKTLNSGWNCFPSNTNKTGFIYHFIGSNKPWYYKNKSELDCYKLYYDYWINSDLKYLQFITFGQAIKTNYIKNCKEIISKYIKK